MRAQKEFSYGGDATVKRPKINEEVPKEEWDDNWFPDQPLYE